MKLSQSIHESVFQSVLAFSRVLWEIDMAERVQIFELTSWVPLASLMVVLIKLLCNEKHIYGSLQSIVRTNIFFHGC